MIQEAPDILSVVRGFVARRKSILLKAAQAIPYTLNPKPQTPNLGPHTLKNKPSTLHPAP